MPDAEARIPPDLRTLAVLTHLSGLAGYIIPLGGVLVPILIWILKSETPIISAIARQAVFLNVVVWLLGGAAALLLLTVVLIPLVFLFWFVLGAVALILPIVGAVKAAEGTYYRYPVVGSSPASSA